MLKHCLPDATEEEVVQMFNFRGCRQKEEPTSVFSDPANAELAEGVLDDDEVLEVKARISKSRSTSNLADKCAASVATARGSKAASSAPNARPLGRKPLPAVPIGQTTYSVEVMNSYCPPVQGCKITLEDKWHSRYRVRCPKAPPNQTSKCFGGASGTTEHDAVVFCLTWAWNVHAQVTSQSCPYELPSLIA